MRYRIAGMICMALWSLGCLGQTRAYRMEMADYRADQNAVFYSPQSSPLSAEQLKTFSGHDYFPIDVRFRVEARFEATPESKPFPLSTNTGATQVYRRLGILHFELEGQKHSIEAYLQVRQFLPRGQKEVVFIPVMDFTTGKETYSAGRYLHLEGIPEGETWIIDFNKLYNPYCAYNERFECPVVPESNHLNIAIKAGMMDYKP